MITELLRGRVVCLDFPSFRIVSRSSMDASFIYFAPRGFFLPLPGLLSGLRSSLFYLLSHHPVRRECLLNPCHTTASCQDNFDSSSIPVGSYKCTCMTSGFVLPGGSASKTYTSGSTMEACTGVPPSSPLLYPTLFVFLYLPCPSST
jgi:hypothetical protein